MTLRELSDQFKTLKNDFSSPDRSSKKTDSEGQLFHEKLDEQLWELLKSGNDASLIALYNRYFYNLISYGYQFTKDKELIEDAVQDLFVDLNVKRRQLPNIKFSVKAYLLKSTKFKIIQYIRQETKSNDAHQESRFFEFDYACSIERNIISKQMEEEQKQRLKRATETLTSRQREVLYYFYNEQLGYDQIKDIMELQSVKSVRNLIYKAISHLRKVF